MSVSTNILYLVFDTILPSQHGLGKFLTLSSLFIVAEELILSQLGEIGLIFHGIGAVTLFVLIYRSEGTILMLYQSMLLIPTLRIFNLGLPLFTSTSLIMLFVLYSILTLSVTSIVRSQSLSITELGLSLDKVLFGIPGFIIGTILGAVQFGFSLESLAFDPNISNIILGILTFGVLVGFVEEIIFRGLIQRHSTELFGGTVAILTTSFLFASMHSVWLDPLDIVFALLVSLLLGILYYRTNNLWLIGIIHGMINVVGFIIGPIYFSSFEGVLYYYLSIV